jgi:hypothetical protein
VCVEELILRSVSACVEECVNVCVCDTECVVILREERFEV